MVDVLEAPPIAPEIGAPVESPTPRDVESTDRRWSRLAPLILVAFAVGFGAWLLRAELRVVPYSNDATFHASMARFAEQRIRSGHNPFDAWYPYLGLGAPQFLQYQSLSHIITGLLSIVFGGSVFRVANYALICTWPISVYAGARLLGLDRRQAGSAALFSPMLVNVVGYGFEWQTFVWTGGPGLWSMLWALWLMPIAIGLAWRAVSRGERLALAAFVVGLTCALHFITGYFVLLAFGVFVLVRPPEMLRRLGRSAVVSVGGLLIFAFVFVPTASNLDFVSGGGSGSVLVRSYGPTQVLGWLFRGELFDFGRAPVVSVLVAIGAIVCLLRAERDESARVPLGLMMLSLLLYSGRRVVGPVIDRLPGGNQVQLQRYIIGVHFAGMLLAGIGAVWLLQSVGGAVRLVLRHPARNVAVVALAGVLAAVALYPVIVNRVRYARTDADAIAGQIAADRGAGREVSDLIDLAKERGGGRIYAGSSNGTHDYSTVGRIAIDQSAAEQDADSIGYLQRTFSLSAGIETEFDPTVAAQYDLFDVKYVLTSAGRQPEVPATELATRGTYALWEVDTSGYLEVVDTTQSVTANNGDMAAVMKPYLTSPAVSELRHPLVAFDGEATPAPSINNSTPYTGPPGTVLRSFVSLDDGRFSGEVRAERPAWVMLKESYAPHWTATVDGKRVKPQMLAPSFVGVPIPAGTHAVVFQYRSGSAYPELFTLGMLTLLALALGPLVWRRRSRRSRRCSGKLPCSS